MAEHVLSPRALLPDKNFNWIYPVDLVAAIIVAIFFLFYFNRLFAALVSYAIRRYTWYTYRVYIDFKALQISPLGGRIFFKGFRYHGRNETIVVHDGYITWRYWLRHVKPAGVNALDGNGSFTPRKESDKGGTSRRETDNGETGGKATRSDLPCRITVKIRGLEWYVYNRSPAYDAIAESILEAGEPEEDTQIKNVRRRNKLRRDSGKTGEVSEKRAANEDSKYELNNGGQKEGIAGQNIVLDQLSSLSNTPSSSRISSFGGSAGSEPRAAIQALPIRLECNKGAVVLGNHHTRSVLVAKFDSASGEVNASSIPPPDLYKQTIDLDFSHPVVQVKANKDFKESQVNAGSRSHAKNHTGDNVVAIQQNNQEGKNIWYMLRNMLPHARSSTMSLAHKRPKTPRSPDMREGVPGETRWLGLTRYMDDEDDLLEQERWKAVEYGRFPTIIDSPKIGVTIRWDVPGKVTRESKLDERSSAEAPVDINGTDPPDWSIDMRIGGGEIHYGPWADRQRIDLQNTFFPMLYKDAAPAASLTHGQSRISTVFNFIVEVEDQTTFVIHTREESKDWKWKGRTAAKDTQDIKRKGRKHLGKRKKGEKENLSPEIRPYGWLDLKISRDSTVKFSMDMVANPSGYRNNLVIELREPEMSSSVNHELLWRSNSQTISCDLSNPLAWNELRQWSVKLQSNGLDMFLLRDHIFLLTDVVNDWASGPAADYYTFVPFLYCIQLEVNDFKLFVNANDSNIINNPTDLNDNVFVDIWGNSLTAALQIPLKRFRPSRNEISFEVQAQNGGFKLHTPYWNTQNTFLDDKNVASLKDLKIDGSYNYFTSTSPSLTDVLRMDIYGDSPTVHLYGFLIRYFMTIKDNYFGEDMHFKTLEEYQAQMNEDGKVVETAGNSLHHAHVSNDLDVILKIRAERSLAMLPARLYSASECVNIDIPSVVADLRFTNYYMDLAVTFSPISFATASSSSTSKAESETGTQIFLDGLEVFGHRLFGLPPTEPTYVCNWDFDIGSVTGQCSVDLLRSLLLGIRCFVFSFDDRENALPPLNPSLIHDVTFLRLGIKPVDLSLQLDDTAFLLGTKGVWLEYNDWARDGFSDRMKAKVSNLTFASIELKGVPNDPRYGRADPTTHAYIIMTLDLHMLKRKANFDQVLELQQNHLKLHDSRTNRTEWLILDSNQPMPTPANQSAKGRPPAMQYPYMPVPLQAFQISPEKLNSSSNSSSTSSSKTSSRESSFLLHKSAAKGRTSFTRLNSFQTDLREGRTPKDGLDEVSRLSPDAEAKRQRGSLTHSGLENVPGDAEAPLQQLRPWSKGVRDRSDNLEPSQPIDPKNDKTSVLIELPQGVRAFCTPSAVGHVQGLLNQLLATDTDALLDTLQMDTIMDILPSLQDHNDGRKIIDLNVRVPFLQARLMSSPSTTLASGEVSHCLEISLEHVNVTSRASRFDKNLAAEAAKKTISFHVALDEISCSLSKTEDHKPTSPGAVRFRVSAPVIWMAHGESTVVDAQFHDLEAVAAPADIGRSIEIATTELVTLESLSDGFDQLTAKSNFRSRSLLYCMVLLNDDIADPRFLARASYVLRSAKDHLRRNDSWKMLCRLRQMRLSLKENARERALDRSMHECAKAAEATRDKVIQNFERWRPWDMIHIKESVLMQKVYGREIHSPGTPAAAPQMLRSSLRAGTLRALLDTSPHPNEFSIEGFALAFQHEPAQKEDSSHTTRDQPALSRLHIHCMKLTTFLYWSMCDMVADVIAKTLPAGGSKNVGRTANPKKANRKLHVVVSSESCLLKLESLNLVNTTLCERLSISALLSADKPGLATNMLFSANTASSETQNHSRTLHLSKLSKASVLAALENSKEPTGEKDTWTVAASCGEIVFKMMEDPLFIMEVIDVCLRDEVSHMSSIMKNIQSVSHETGKMTTGEATSVDSGAHVTLFVDSYLVSVVLMSTLSYKVSGRIARATIQHGLRHTSKTRVDWDVKDHSHTLTTSNKGASEDVAALEIPPINGCLHWDSGPGQQYMLVHMMVESILLDASAIHTLLVIASRPEIANLITNIEREARHLQKRIEQVFPNSKGSPKEESLKPPLVLYDAHLIVVGLGVQATSPMSSAATRAGQLHFNLGSLQVNTTNKDPNAQTALEFAEVEVRIDSIYGALLRIENNGEHHNGDLAISALLQQTSKFDIEKGKLVRVYQVSVTKFELNVNAETPTMVTDIMGHLQDTLKTIELSPELERLRTLGRTKFRSEVSVDGARARRSLPEESMPSNALFGAIYSLEMTKIQIIYKIGSSTPISPGREAEDLILSFSRIDLSTKRDNAARLLIENLQLQMVPTSKAIFGRSLNSALLPEVVFNVAYLSTGQDRRLAFQAAGKSLDLRLASKFILAASDLRRSIAFAAQEVRNATANWNASAEEKGTERKTLLGDKRFSSILVDADFAGAVVYVQGRSIADPQISAANALHGGRMPQHGRYNQFTPENVATNTTLRAPGLAFKIEFKDGEERSLNAEVKVDASSNELHPTVVPLIMEISSSVQEMIADPESPQQSMKSMPAQSKFIGEDKLRSADPSALFGKCKVNLGLRICRQEFSLTCQPIARVAAVARLEDIYITVNTVQSIDHGQFYSLSAVFRNLQASVQHAYSRDSTGSLDIESIFVSLMSSKHVSDTTGLSMILKISPSKAQINARQIQDFLLFREIWIPSEIRNAPGADVPSASAEPQDFIVQRYQQVASAGAFPWNATLAIARLDVYLDLGQSLGRTTFTVADFWMSSKKTSDWEQNLCVGFDNINVNSTGRMSGLVELQNLKIRTSIQWPMVENAHHQTPLIQASMAFEHLLVKAAFEYQAFAVANVTSVDFFMYNVRNLEQASNDRLVSIVRGDKVQGFCTSASASQGLALFQAVQRLIQERQAAYQSSLKDVERFLRRRSAVNPLYMTRMPQSTPTHSDDAAKLPIKLQTEVIVRLGAVNFGVFPATFFDNQIFKAEALNASAQFSVVLEHGKIRSSVGLTLGQLRIALSATGRPGSPKKVGDFTVDEVVSTATGSRGGTILKVPKVIASMQTWQLPESTQIDYIFTSSFQGNIDVGWNYSRIRFIRGMIANHSRTLAQRLGKPISQSAVQITGGPQPDGEKEDKSDDEQEKITAVVNVPMSKYQYTALQEPVIDTPKLTQLGDATPPLEWIGLHRERLPNLTHQIVIVSLLEVAKEVEDAYARILGSS